MNLVPLGYDAEVPTIRSRLWSGFSIAELNPRVLLPMLVSPIYEHIPKVKVKLSASKHRRVKTHSRGNEAPRSS
jgi:hypothetical protein